MDDLLYQPMFPLYKKKRNLRMLYYFHFYTKIPLVSYNNYSGLKKQLQEKNICYKDNHGLFVYNSESITKRRVGENGRMFGILM